MIITHILDLLRNRHFAPDARRPSPSKRSVYDPYMSIARAQVNNADGQKCHFVISLILITTLTGCSLIGDKNNIHQVGTAPNIYRSAQLDSNELSKLIRDKDIDIVLNLRGEFKGADWYEAEKATCTKLGVQHIDVGLSMTEAPSKKNLLKILEILKESKEKKQDLLIHCRAGSDRTGLISSIARISLYGESTDEAMLKGLNLVYGHLPDPGSVLELILREYKPYEKEMDFETWLRTKYNRKELDKLSKSLPRLPH